MHAKFVSKFTEQFVNTIISELKRQIESNGPRVTRKEYLAEFHESDHPAITLVLHELMNDATSGFDQEKGPGGGMGYTGSGKSLTGGAKHITLSDEEVAAYYQTSLKILGQMKGCSPAVLASQMGDLSDNGISRATAALTTLVAQNKLENRRGVGYCKPAKKIETPVKA